MSPIINNAKIQKKREKQYFEAIFYVEVSEYSDYLTNFALDILYKMV